MTQNKSVEEVVKKTWQDIQDHIYHEPMSIGQANDFEKSQWIALLQQERQTSQEREREIVEEYQKSIDSINGSVVQAHKTLNRLTNPNKD